MRNKSEKEARVRMVEDLRKLQEDLTDVWVDRSLPTGWAAIEDREMVKRPKERVTIRLDGEMMKWFRKLGPGYGPRINAILRIYWSALVAGEVKSHWEEHEVVPPFEDYIQRMADVREARKGDGG